MSALDSRPGWAPLHELSTLERQHISAGKLEPFTVLAPGFESVVPISLNPGRIVCADRVDGFRLFRKLDRELSFASAG
jgi:hypothetical protein